MSWVRSREDLRRQGSDRRRRRRMIVAGVIVVVAGVATAALLLRNDITAMPQTSGATCPLTGEAPPGRVVPARPALAVKIGNYSDDRPSAGLNQADVVFEEPVEGSITRLVAVFHCQAPILVGDVRSAREPDVGILSQLSDPIIVHAGGIDPVLALLSHANLIDENVLSAASGTVVHPAGRSSPYSTFVKPDAIWALNSSDTTMPAPLFDYTAALPTGALAGSGTAVHIPFSHSSDVTWKWDPTTAHYVRYYSASPDVLADGTQTSATNIVTMMVHTSMGPWVESAGGAREVEVVATGSGPLVVLRGGAALTGTWSRSSPDRPATLTAADGTNITLQPGNSWVELVPEGIPVSTTSSTP